MSAASGSWCPKTHHRDLAFGFRKVPSCGLRRLAILLLITLSGRSLLTVSAATGFKTFTEPESTIAFHSAASAAAKSARSSGDRCFGWTSSLLRAKNTSTSGAVSSPSSGPLVQSSCCKVCECFFSVVDHPHIHCLEDTKFLQVTPCVQVGVLVGSSCTWSIQNLTFCYD